MLRDIHVEILMYIQMYTPFVVGDLIDELDSYINHGNYSHGTADLIVNALANVYQTRIIIHGEDGGHLVIEPRGGNPVREANLRKRGEHYDALIPATGELSYSVTHRYSTAKFIGR
jgi:hypothetical protein